MRDNLVFHGIQESARETWDDTKREVRKFLKDKMKMPATEADSLAIDRVHRSGAKGKRPRPIVARFLNSESKSKVFQYVRNLHSQKDLGVQDQFPPEIAERRKRLLPLHKEAKNAKKNVRWAVDKLIIDGKVHSAPDDNFTITLSELQFDAEIVHTVHVQVDGSTFIGHAANIENKDDIPEVLGKLHLDRSLTSATHNAYAYRILRGSTTIEGSKDDQEHGAGTALLEQLRKQEKVNVLTVVSRWSGTKLMGPKRFQVYKDCAKSATELLQ